MEAAELVGNITDVSNLNVYIKSPDPTVRFWALNAVDGFNGDISEQKENLINALKDPSIPNRGLAAEILINKLGEYEQTTKTLETLLLTTENEVALLHIAVNTRNIGNKANPLVPIIQEQLFPKIAGDVWGRYKNWSYPMFIGMALDQTLTNCGVPLE